MVVVYRSLNNFKFITVWVGIIGKCGRWVGLLSKRASTVLEAEGNANPY